jgi:hypothetical protein
MAKEIYATLRERLRLLVGDAGGVNQVFSDDDLDAFLDRTRYDAREFQLGYALAAPGYSLANYFFAPVGDWADDVVLRDNNGTTITLGGQDVADLVRGSWSFNTPRLWPLWISGTTVDLYSAAEQVCLAWAAKVAIQHDLSTSGLSLSRSQKQRGLLDQAKQFAKKKRASSVVFEAAL